MEIGRHSVLVPASLHLRLLVALAVMEDWPGVHVLFVVVGGGGEVVHVVSFADVSDDIGGENDACMMGVARELV